MIKPVERGSKNDQKRVIFGLKEFFVQVDPFWSLLTTFGSSLDPLFPFLGGWDPRVRPKRGSKVTKKGHFGPSKGPTFEPATVSVGLTFEWVVQQGVPKSVILTPF